MAEGVRRVVRWRGEAYLLDPGKELVVGRIHGCHLLVDDPSVSRRHAALRHDEGGFVVEDLGSANGTFLDGARVAGRAPAGSGAVVSIGAEQMALDVAEPGEIVVRLATALPITPATQKSRDDTTLTGIERTDTMLDGCERLARGGRWKEAAAALASALPDVIAAVETRPGSGPEALRRASRIFTGATQHGHGQGLVPPIVRLHELCSLVPDEATANAMRAVAQDDATRAVLQRFASTARKRSLSASDLKRLDRFEKG